MAQGVRLRRFPYLQQVTTDRALVVWTASGKGVAHVRVREPVEVVRADADNVPLPDGARQFVATLQGLRPATRYCYEVFHNSARVAGPLAFRTAPLPRAYPLTFAVLGDSGGGGADQATVLRQLDAADFDALLHVGDIAYPRGRLDEFERNFFAVYRLILSGVPIFPASGNHEHLTDDAAPFRQVFVLPDNGVPGTHERTYSFDYGSAHFAVLDTEHINDAQAAWLDADLKRSFAAWKLVYGHRPPHSSGPHGGDPAMQALIEPVLQRNRVPLAFFGHDHHYERFAPISGVTYVISGGGGRGVRPLEERAASSVVAKSVLSFVRLTLHKDEAVVQAIDGAGRAFDEAHVPRPQ